jgi:hypothetical protein
VLRKLLSDGWQHGKKGGGKLQASRRDKNFNTTQGFVILGRKVTSSFQL